ncbi:MAG: DUF4349 domain-containing protein, partial [Oscillospiraceae bacterium]|nr:DUF4349 domain-containing protein [Oscillospiraceae bacterium]
MKNSKKIFVLCLAAMLLAIFSAGCSSAMDGYFNNIVGGDSANRAEYATAEAGAFYEYDMYDAESSYLYSSAPAEGGGTMSMNMTMEGSNLPAERKIIRDADITAESDDVGGAYDAVLALLSGLGGYESGRNMYTNSYGYPIVSATLKIPAGKLDAFLAEIADKCEVKSSNISSSDITDQYFDAQIRLDTLEKTLENYYRYLENAESVEVQLEVTRYINDVTYQIEQLKGSLRRWDSLVDYSTVTLSLYPINAAPEEPREIKWDSLSLSDMGWFISSGFLSVCNAIFSVLQWLLISIAAISPILIIAAALIFLL